MQFQQYSAGGLDDLVDAPRITRTIPSKPFDSQKFSQVRWLVVEEPISLVERVSGRTLSILDQVFGGDWGKIQAHRERFASPVERALFAILLAPWEDWVESPGIDWLGFQVPWAYAVDDNIFERTQVPPSPDTLSWEPDFVYGGDDEWIEGERPIQYSFNDAVHQVSDWLNDNTWAKVSTARQSPLFETPIAPSWYEHSVQTPWTSSWLTLRRSKPLLVCGATTISPELRSASQEG